MRKVLETCTNKPKILVGGGPWYPVGPGQDGVRGMGARDVGEERNAIERTIVQDGQEEDEGVLQQHQREKRTGKHHPLPRPIHDMVQPPEKASEHRSNPYGGGLILTVSTRTAFLPFFLTPRPSPLVPQPGNGLSSKGLKRPRIVGETSSVVWATSWRDLLRG